MVIVDASVAIKWFFEEPYSPAAERIARTNEMIAPDLLVQEMHNVLWKKLRNRTIEVQDATQLALDMSRAVVRLVPNATLADRAAQIMIEAVHPIYDCLYLALAEREHLPLITEDRGLIEAGRRCGIRSLQHISDFTI